MEIRLSLREALSSKNRLKTSLFYFLWHFNTFSPVLSPDGDSAAPDAEVTAETNGKGSPEGTPSPVLFIDDSGAGESYRSTLQRCLMIIHRFLPVLENHYIYPASDFKSLRRGFILYFSLKPDFCRSGDVRERVGRFSCLNEFYLRL